MSVAQQTKQAATAATILNYVSYSGWTIANKWQFMSVESGGFGMDTPMLATSFQMISAGAVAAIFVLVFGVQRQPQSKYFSVDVLKKRILPLGFSRAVDIGCGNFALVLVSVSLQQVVKSLLPVFVSVLTVTVLKNHVAKAIWISLLPIIFGCFLATMQQPSLKAKSGGGTPHHEESGGTPHHETDGEVQSHHLAVVGLALAVVSCVGRAFKAVLNAKLLHTRQGDNLKPLEILLMEAPTTGLLLIVPALMLGEGSILMGHIWESSATSAAATVSSMAVGAPGAHDGGNSAVVVVHSFMSLLSGLWTILTGSKVFWYNVGCGVLMFFNQGSYITIIEQTSALSCQVLMNMKMLLLIMISVHIFHTDLSIINYLGIALATGGVFLYGRVSSGPRIQFIQKPLERIV